MVILRHLLVFVFLNFCCSAFSQPETVNPVLPDTSVITEPVADITITDTSSEKLFIASISVYGNKKTKTYILEREIPFKQGDYILKKDLQKKLDLARRQLINTSLFLEAEVNIENQAGDFVFITVNVKERWYLFPLPYFKLADRNFNTWWVTYNHTLSRVNYGVKFLYNNVSGHNDKLNVWFITGYNKQIAFKYDRPYFDKTLKNGFNFNFTFGQQKEINFKTDSSHQKFLKTEDNYIRQALRISADYVYRPAIKTRHIFRLGYTNEKIADTVLNPITGNPGYYPNNKTQLSYPEFYYGIQFTNADYNAYPTKGLKIEGNIQHKGINNDVNLTQLLVSGSYTMPIAPRDQVQFAFGGLIKLPFNQPFFNRQLFGYGNIFMQGLEYYVIDGVAGAIGRVTGSRRLLDVILKPPEKIKKQVKIPVQVYGKIFTNTGYGYNKDPGNSLLNNRFLYSGGFGLDVVVIYDLVFKFDYSFNQFGESGLFLHAKKDF